MDLARVFEKAQCDGMHRGIAPSLVEESTGSIQVVEIIFVGLATPKFHICNLEIRPEMAGRISMGFYVVVRPSFVIHKPFHCIVLMQILWMGGQELDSLRPQGRYALRRVIQIDGETVRFVMVLHIAEDIVVDIAKEANVWLYTPVVPGVGECWMFVEHAAVPATHLVIGNHIAVLHIALLEHLCGLLEEVHIDPVGRSPMLLRDHLCIFISGILSLLDAEHIP